MQVTDKQNKTLYSLCGHVDEVITAKPTDTISDVIDIFLDRKISAVIVIRGDQPVGIITKTDVAKAYRDGYSLDQTVENVMTTDLKTVKRDVSHDQAASIFAAHRIHHAIVTDDDGKFAGLISAWDVAKEGYLDSEAWPWNRGFLKTL